MGIIARTKEVVSQYSRSVVYAILILCLCIIVAYIIVVGIAFSKYGKRVLFENIKILNIITTITIACAAVASIIIRFVPFVRYPALRIAHSIPIHIDNILDSGNTPYFNPPVYKFKHGQYIRTSNIPFDIDKFGLPIVDENVPLNSFNMALFRRFHKADIVEYSIIKNDIAALHVNNSSFALISKQLSTLARDISMDELIFKHIESIFDSVSDILRIHTVGDKCLVVKSVANAGVLVHKDKYTTFISDPLVMREIRFVNDYKLRKYFRITELMQGLDWLTNTILAGEPGLIDPYNKYIAVYDELRVLYALLVTNTSDADKYEAVSAIASLISNFAINDPRFGLVSIMNAMIIVSTINYCVEQSRNLILTVGKYMMEQPQLDMSMFYSTILQTKSFIHIPSILRDVYENHSVFNILSRIGTTIPTTIIDALSSTARPLDINTIEIKILLPYLEEYGMREVIEVHNRNVDTISRTIDGIINTMKEKRNKLLISKLLQNGEKNISDAQIQMNDELTKSKRDPAESAKALFTSVRKLRSIIDTRIQTRNKILNKDETTALPSAKREIDDIQEQNDKEQELKSKIDSKMPALIDAVKNITSKMSPITGFTHVISMLHKTPITAPINLPMGPTEADIPQMPAPQSSIPMGPTQADIPQMPAPQPSIPIGPTEDMLNMISSFTTELQVQTQGSEQVAQIVDSTMTDMLNIIDEHSTDVDAIIDTSITQSPIQTTAIANTESMLAQVEAHAAIHANDPAEFITEIKQNEELAAKMLDIANDKMGRYKIDMVSLSNIPADLSDEVKNAYNSIEATVTAIKDVVSKSQSSIDQVTMAEYKRVISTAMDKINLENENLIRALAKIEDTKNAQQTAALETVNNIATQQVAELSQEQSLAPAIVSDILAQTELQVIEQQYQTEIKNMQVEQSIRAKEIEDKQLQIQNMQSMLEVSERKLSEMVAASDLINKDSTEQLLQINQQMADTRSKNAELESQKMVVDAELKQLAADIEASKAEFDSGIISIAQYPSMLQAVSAAQMGLNTNMAKYTQEHNNNVSNIRYQISALVQQQQQAMDAAYRAQLQQEIQTRQEQADQMQREFDEKIRQSVMEFKLSLVNTVGGIEGIDISSDNSLEECIGSIMSFVEKSKNKTAAAADAIRNLEDKEASLLSERDVLSSELQRVQQAYEESKAETDNAKRALEINKQELAQTKADLQERLDNTQKQLSDAQLQFESNLAAQSSQSVAEIENLKNQNQVLQMQISTLESQEKRVDPEEFMRSVEEVSRLTAAIQEYKTKYATDIKEYADIKNKLSSAIAENDNLQQQIDKQRETFAKTMARERDSHRSNLTYCMGMGGEYKNKKMETLYKIGGVVNFRYEPITNAPKLTAELVGAMSAYVDTILKGETPPIASSNPVLGKIYALTPKLVFRTPNDKIRHGSVDWEMITIIYSIYGTVGMKHSMIMSDLSKCGITEDNVSEFNDNIRIMDSFMLSCDALFGGQVDNKTGPNLSIFTFINNDSNIKPVFKKIALLYNSKTQRYEYGFTPDTISFAFDRLRILLSIFGFGTSMYYDSINDPNYELNPEYQHWVTEFSKEIKLNPKERAQPQTEDNKLFNPKYGQMMQAIKDGLDESPRGTEISEISQTPRSDTHVQRPDELVIDEVSQ